MENILPKRKNIRIPEYDYSQNGYYFITICTKHRQKILSKIVGVGVPDDPLQKHTNNKMQIYDIPKIQLTKNGIIVEEYIKSINKTYKDIKINDYIIMPNHIHMICIIEKQENGSSRTPTPTNAKIPFLISTFKRLINKRCNQSIWQRGYYEHVIRGESEYLSILEYIENNPLKWEEDIYNTK